MRSVKGNNSLSTLEQAAEKANAQAKGLLYELAAARAWCFFKQPARAVRP
jgi:hypothetical protein